MDPILREFGVPVTVTRPAPDDDPIQTTGVWVLPITEDVPLGTEFQRKERRRILALDRDEVPTVPRGTVIVAAERAGDDAQTWRVDGLEFADADHHRVRVVLEPAP
jgi:hypothetical protein